MTDQQTTDLNLELLEEFGSEMSGRRGFDATFLKFNANTGEWTAGKAGTSMNKQKIVADIPDVMRGYQRFCDNKPVYALVRVADGISPPRREHLGDTDERLWDRNDGDPWKYVGVLPLFNPELRETLILSTSTDGGTKAIGSLVKAFAAEQRQRFGKLPLVELDSDRIRINGVGGHFSPSSTLLAGWTGRPRSNDHCHPRCPR